MSRSLQLTPWRQHLATRFPQLPATTVLVLALYSFGMIFAKVSGLSSIALFLGKLLGCPYFALRKRLAEFYKEAPAKSGVKQGIKRRDFDVTTCFPPLLRWILTLWTGRQLPLAIDVTNLGERFHVLCIAVVVRGCSIPVAWKVLYGGLKDPWNPHWKVLLEHLKPAVPDGWSVIVLSDRGLESPALFGAIKAQGWHPLMRVKKGGKFRPTGWGKYYPFAALLRNVGGAFAAEGRAYAGAKMPCTLLACWTAGHAEPWLLLTDLPPEAGNAVWYGFRTWIEQGFKVIKGGCWDWEKTRMEDPGRVERLWLVLSVATLWVMAIGIADEVRQERADELQALEKAMTQTREQAQQRQQRERQQRQNQQEALQKRKERQQKRAAAKEEQRAKTGGKKKAKTVKKGQQAAAKAVGHGQAARQALADKTTKAHQQEGKARLHRVTQRGLAELQACWGRGENGLPQHLHPEPWPEVRHSVASVTEKEFLSQQT